MHTNKENAKLYFFYIEIYDYMIEWYNGSVAYRVHIFFTQYLTVFSHSKLTPGNFGKRKVR